MKHVTNLLETLRGLLKATRLYYFNTLTSMAEFCTRSLRKMEKSYISFMGELEQKIEKQYEALPNLLQIISYWLAMVPFLLVLTLSVLTILSSLVLLNLAYEISSRLVEFSEKVTEKIKQRYMT